MQKVNKKDLQPEKQNNFIQIIRLCKIIDFRNCRYQGGISKVQQKEGVGCCLDDNLSFMISQWKQNMPNQKTLIITRCGSYIYGLWNQNQSNFSGLTIIQTANYLTLVNFQNGHIKGKAIIFSIFEKSVLVIDKLQIIDNILNQKHIQIIQFTKFSIEFNLKSLIEIYINKYSFFCAPFQLSVDQFMKSFIKRYKKHKQQHEGLIKVVNKQKKDKTIKEEKQNNSQNIICFHQKQHQTKKKTNQYYFGFSEGIGVNFKLIQSKFKLLTIGIHHNQRIRQFGLKFHDQRCVQEGNFLQKMTFTYLLQIQRPFDKLLSIYQKIHKKSLSFSNQYFQIKLLYLSMFDNYLSSKGAAIFSDCQKQQLKKQNQMNNQQEKLFLLQQIKQNQIKKKSSRKTVQKMVPIKIQSDFKQNEENKNQLLKCIQQKKQQLNTKESKVNKVKKVKYQMQYTNSDKPVSFFRRTDLISPISAKLDLSKSKVNIANHKKSKSPINKKQVVKKSEQVNKKFQNLTKKNRQKQRKSPLYDKNFKGQKVFHELNIQKLLQKKTVQKNLNKFNGRQKKYSDQELDAMIKDYKFRKQRYNHINNAKVESQQEKYAKQRLIQDKIRAQLSKMTTQEYQQYQKIRQIQAKHLQELVLRQNQILEEKIRLNQIQSIHKEENRRLCGCKKHPHLQREVYVYPLQENLAQKRKRILSDFKNLNKNNLNEEDRLQDLKISYGKILNELVTPNSSRTHYQHAFQTTFSKNAFNPLTFNLKDEYLQERSIKEEMQRSRKIQKQMLKQQEANLKTHILQKHIIEEGMHLSSGNTRYHYYFQ